MDNRPRRVVFYGGMPVVKSEPASGKLVGKRVPGFSTSTAPVPKPMEAGPFGGAGSGLLGLHGVAYGSLPLGLRRR
jgi:hypothetical protein